MASLASDLRTLLELIDSGGLSATSAMRQRIEGAIALIEVVVGGMD